MKNILIIGGFGFIGTHLGNIYEKYNYKVFKTTRHHNIRENETSFRIDYSEESFKKIFIKHNFDYVFYLSGNPYPAISENKPLFDIEQTVIPTLNLLNAMVKAKFTGVFWFGSSVAVYGKTLKKFQEEADLCKPLSNYALAKITCEQYLKLFSDTHGLLCGSLRLFSTFGEGLRRQIVFDLYQKAINEEDFIEIIGTGKEERDLCYVGDQVKRIKILADLLKPMGDIYNVGNGTSINTRNIAEKMLEITGKNKSIKFSNNKRTFDGYKWRASTKKFLNLSKNPKTDFTEALKKTINSYNFK